MVDLKLLDIFVVIAQEKSFTRAALRLNTSQPPLSKAISKLEHQLKVKLFHRTTRKVTLTPEGAALLNQANVLKNSINQSLQTIYNTFSSFNNTIRIGGTTLSYLKIIPSLINLIAQKHADIELKTFELSNNMIIDKLLNGELDIGFILLPTKHKDLTIQHLECHTMKLAVSSQFHLPQNKKVNLSFFKDECFIMHNRFVNPGMFDEIVYCCQQANFEPKLKEIDKHSNCMAQVSANAGVHFVICEMKLDHVQYLDVTPSPQLKIGVAYRTNNNSKKLESILNIITHSISPNKN